MRWKAVYLILALALFFGVVGCLFLNRLLEWSFERSLETAVGARVEIERIRLDLRRLTLDVGRLQVTNPRNTWRNFFEAAGIHGRLALTPLYAGKIVLEEIAVDELILDTPRKTDGKLHRRLLPGPLGAAQAKLNRDIAAIPLLDLGSLQAGFSLGAILPQYDFETDREAESLRARLGRTDLDWTSEVADLDSIRAKVQEISQQVRTIQEIKPQNLLEMQQQLAALQGMQRSLADFRNQLDETGHGLQRDLTGLAKAVRDLKQVADRDYQALLALARLPDLQSFQISEALFGRALLHESALFVDLADKLSAYAPADGQAKPKHVRGGVDIAFPGRRTYPRLLIKQVSLSSGVTGAIARAGFRASGSVRGITSEPSLYGRPMTAALSAAGFGQGHLDLNASIDHVTPRYRDEISLHLSELSLPEIPLGEGNDWLPHRIVSGHADVTAAVRLQPDYFRLDLKLAGREISGDYSGQGEAPNLVTRLVREVLARIDELVLEYRLESTNGRLQMLVRSNMDGIISAKINEMIGEEVARATAEIRQAVDAELRKEQENLERARKECETRLAARVAEAESLVDQQNQAIEDLRKKLTVEIQKKLGGALLGR